MAGDSMASMMEFLGISDPAVDPDGVREIAKKWRALAKAIDASVKEAEHALKDVTWEGKTATAFSKRAKKARSQATTMADSLRDGADALDKFADEAHELLTELNVIILEIIEVEMAGLALSVLTGGASAVVGSLAAGARFAKAMALIGRIERSGTAMARTIRVVLEVIRGLSRALKALKDIKSIAKAGKLAGSGAKYAALDALLQDPATFKDPGKLAETLALGAALGVGIGGLGKLLGKGLGKLKPKDLAKLRSAMKLNCASFKRLSMRPGFDKLPASVRNALKKFVRDPIDVATGDMALPRTDIQLPGVLPLLLERTHISSYRFGGWFGPSWASTLDQRVQADDEGLVYAAADGARLCFPMPDPEAEAGGPVAPETPGSRLTLSWDGELDGAVRVTDPDSGLTQVFHSPVPAADGEAVDLPLQYVQDRNGNRITIEYDEADIPAAVVHSGGYHIALDRDASNSRIMGLRLLDPASPSSPGTTIVTFGYDETGRLSEETNSSGLPMRYTYDEAGRITSWTDRNGTTYWYTYDERGRVTETGGTGDALASTLVYDDTTHTTRVTDSLGHTRIYEHNDACRLIRETDPLGHLTTQEWDEDLQLVAVTDALGHTTRYRYDHNGRIVLVTRPDGHELRSEYNELGLPTVITGPAGDVWNQQYNEYGNRVAVTDPAGATTRFTYTSTGHLTSITDALGNLTLFRCDTTGLPLDITDPLGARTRYIRDSFGQPTTITDPLGNKTRLQWTVDGKPARRTAPDGTEETWTYDNEGNCLSHSDPKGAVTRFEYTHFDLISARTDPDGARHTFRYDTELHLIEVTNPQKLTWSYHHDPAGRLVSETDFDGRTLTYTLDAADRLTARTNALGQTTRFERDAAGQTIRKTTEDGDTSFVYTAAGQLVTASAPDTTVHLEHDALGRVLSETVNGLTTAYEYDQLGRRIRRTTPSGARSSWSYDAAGNTTQLDSGNHTIAFERDVSGQELTRHIDAVTTLSHTFDELGRLTSQRVRNADGRDIQRRDYTYRADGHLIGLNDHLNGQKHFTLDRAGRVTTVDSANWAERYAYDTAGNLTDAAWPATHPGHDATGERAYAGTRIMRAGHVRYEHDALGRITLRQKSRVSRKPDTWRYTWDAEDRLVAVITPDGAQWHYLYDALGRRIAKQRMAPDGTTIAERTFFTWDGSTLCEQTTVTHDCPDPVTLTWDHAGLQPLAQSERMVAADSSQDEIDSRFFAIVTDLVGTPTELLDEQGVIAWRSRSTLWGTTAWTAGSTAYTPLRFPGQYFDPETGLHYNNQRHYDPETARYLTPDPLGLAPAPNPTAYVQNPHRWADPLGLAPECTVDGYRKQTDHPLSRRIHIGEDGKVTITGKGSLYVNLSGDIRHTVEFRGEGGQIVQFKISEEFRDKIRRLAVPQKQPAGLGFTDAEWKQVKKIYPEISDPTRGDDLYGIPSGMLDEFRREVAKYPGRVVQEG
ncbi:DUF6531 domain-containing protein [Streptomyces sp. NPDC086554]|uniref:DUF6531 domain-containing protein n=1 Tax=Streptomyces sp. NPDC086554 TaxID=3154864 RepID=UPI003428452C